MNLLFVLETQRNSRQSGKQRQGRQFNFPAVSRYWVICISASCLKLFDLSGSFPGHVTQQRRRPTGIHKACLAEEKRGSSYLDHDGLNNLPSHIGVVWPSTFWFALVETLEGMLPQPWLHTRVRLETMLLPPQAGNCPAQPR